MSARAARVWLAKRKHRKQEGDHDYRDKTRIVLQDRMGAVQRSLLTGKQFGRGLVCGSRGCGMVQRKLVVKPPREHREAQDKHERGENRSAPYGSPGLGIQVHGLNGEYPSVFDGSGCGLGTEMQGWPPR
jgi:hypothetical protein